MVGGGHAGCLASLVGASLASAALVIAAVAAAASCSAGASAKRFCGEVGKVPVVSSADQLRGPGGQATLSQLRGALDRLADRAPSDVHADVVTLSKVTGQLQEALARQDEGDEAARDRARAELDGGLATFA